MSIPVVPGQAGGGSFHPIRNHGPLENAAAVTERGSAPSNIPLINFWLRPRDIPVFRRIDTAMKNGFLMRFPTVLKGESASFVRNFP